MPGLGAVAARLGGRSGLGRLRRVPAGLARTAGFWAGMARRVDPTLVLHESSGGRGMLCNPEAVFRALLAAPDLQHLEHVWALRDTGSHPDLLAEFADHPRVRFVEHGSARYWYLLERAGYLVNNATFGPAFLKRDGQTYLNTWHGTPVKRMGYHLAGGGVEADNIVRDLLSADYLLSANPHMSEQMYRQGYRLGEVFTGELLEVGYPRIDQQFEDPGPARARVRRSGLRLDDRSVVLYAPTWRGGSFAGARADVELVEGTVRTLRAAWPPERYRVLVRPHPSVHQELAARDDLREALVPAGIPTNRVLAATDVLVTDYSSLFFDFLTTGRPIFFHVPDLAAYQRDRGLYLAPAELPGPVTQSGEQLTEEVRHYLARRRTGHEAALAEAAARYCPAEDGRATGRVVDVVFRARAEGREGGVRRRPPGGRPRVLLHLGPLLTNGVTSSALTLLRVLQTDWDVTVLYPWSDDPVRLRNAARIPAGVRQLRRRPGFTRLPLALAHRAQVAGLVHRPWPARLWRAEWRRVTGGAEFDRVVDFSGYSPYWTSLLLASGRPLTLWQHNDMAADARREIDGRTPLRRDLEAVARLHRRCAALVSVSEPLAAVNRAALAPGSGGVPFLAVDNAVDAERVRAGAVAGPPAVPDLRGTGVATVVCVGRLSPEKNHARLLDAFAELRRDAPGRHRLVVVGDGPLRASLERQVRRLGLTDDVTLTGSLDNPWSTMAVADCLAVSSDYEGQPMVILEARVLGLPVVSTRFASAAAAVPPGAGLVVEPTAPALALGIRSVLTGDVRIRPLDVAAHDAAVAAQFTRAVARE